MRVIPGMTVLVPADAIETPKAIFAAAEYYGPVYIRLARLKIPVVTKTTDPFVIGKSGMLREGNDATVIACGMMVSSALSAAEMLAQENINITVINSYTIKPLDTKTIISQAERTRAIVTAEEHLGIGGLGSAVSEVLSQNCPVPIEMIAIKDRFGQSGESDELLKEYNLTANDIVQAVKKVIIRKPR
jgi:transketolase